MKTKLEKMFADLQRMRDGLQEKIDNAGDSEAAQERADHNGTIAEYLENAIGELESAIGELE